MTTLKRIGKIANFDGTKVKLIVTQDGYDIKMTEVFGYRVPITLLSRDIVNSSSTVDDLFDRYLRKTQIDSPGSRIVIDGTSGKHEVSIKRPCDNEIIVTRDDGDNIIITKKGNLIRVMIGEKDPIDDQWYPTPSSLIHYYEFDEYGELIYVKKI